MHDYLNQYGGAERVLEALCEIFPKAPIFTLIYDAKKTGYAFNQKIIKTSFLQKFPFAINHHRLFFPLMPLAVEQFDFSKYDLVISDSASYAKGIIVAPKTTHINYCLTPTRYIWDDSQKYLKEFRLSRFFRSLAPFFLNYVRVWDFESSHRPDQMVAISKFVAERIKKYYQRTPSIIYPPVNVESFSISDQVESYFLMVGRFLPYKKFDLAIEAFNKLGLPLKIIGDGPQKNYLKKIAGSNIEFIGLVDDKKLAWYLRRCQALIFPQNEDFGIVAVEAMASGRPVIAFSSGGAMEIIKEGVSGLFFKEQTVEALIDAVEKFRKKSFNSGLICNEALKFSKGIFKAEMQKFVDQTMASKK